MPDRLIDLSYPLNTSTPVWPGSPPVTVQVLDAIPSSRAASAPAPDEPGYLNATSFGTCSHTGTHMDAPAHFYNGVPTIDRVPLAQCIGPCSLLRLPNCRPKQELSVTDLEPVEQALRRTGKLVLATGWATHWGQPDYFEDFPVLSESAAQWLIDCGLVLIGLDTPSVDRVPYLAHRVLLGAHAVIIENLTNLEAIDRSEFELIATPLPLDRLEASPIRAVARLAAI